MRYLIFFFLFFTNTAFSTVVVLNGLTHVHNGVKGSEMKGKISIRNDGKSPARVLIYTLDLVSECGGSPDYVKSNSHPNSLSSWTRTNVDEKTLGPKEEYDVLYTINVPSSGVNDGSYWQLVMIEGADPIKENSEQGFVVSSKIRYGVQLVANVGSFESPVITFENVDFLKSDVPLITIHLKNRGTFSTTIKLALELYDEEGKKLKKIEAGSKRIYPAFCNTFSIDVSGIPKGKYVGLIVADNGTDLFGTNLSLEL